MYQKIRPLIIFTFWLIIPIVLIGCGTIDDNTQPEIDTINDKSLDVGDTQTVGVRITDIDIDDMHTINVASNNPNVATVTVDEEFLAIKGNAVGMATITVTATDDSGQDNATSLPVTFQVTVNEPPPPPIDRGFCVVGMTLQSGEGCTYIANQIPVLFFVREDGGGCRSSQQPGYAEIFGIPVKIEPIDDDSYFCVYDDIRTDTYYGTEFSADKNSDGSWTIDEVP